MSSFPIPCFPTARRPLPVLNVVDGQRDLLSPSVVSVGATSPTPGLMVLVSQQEIHAGFQCLEQLHLLWSIMRPRVSAKLFRGTSASITLPGFSESIVVAPDNVTGFAAVPNAQVTGTGQSPGVVEVLDLSNDVISAALPVPGARYLAQSHNGNRVLVLGSRPNTVTVLAPSSVGTSTDPRTDVQSPLFDHPVWAVFSSDDSTAYILNCGPECGGTDRQRHAAGREQQPARAHHSGGRRHHRAAFRQHLYVAGPSRGPTLARFPPPTLATTCGEVSAVDLGSMTVTATATITDGYHNHMEMGANDQLFIGARTCTNIKVPASGSNPGEVRGCLSIFNTSKSTVVVPPDW